MLLRDNIPAKRFPVVTMALISVNVVKVYSLAYLKLYYLTSLPTESHSLDVAF